MYFGLNHYGWFTHIDDSRTGEDLLPKIREMVARNGFLPQDAEQREKSWLDTYGMVQTLSLIHILLKKTGAMGFVRPSDVHIQVIYGPKVEGIASHVREVLKY